MVRVKVACKDPSKIPRKRLFEMKNKFYLIHFKVEGAMELDPDGVIMARMMILMTMQRIVGWKSSFMIQSLRRKGLLRTIVRIRLVLVRIWVDLQDPVINLAVGRELLHGQVCFKQRKRFLG
jgi:hypothetical protein